MTEGPCALLTGSGKDATLALHRARHAGWDVRFGVSLYDGPTERIAFHGTRPALVRAQLEALELEPIVLPVGEEGFEPAFQGALQRLLKDQVTGVVLGNIHLADVRAWYEERITGQGLGHIEPLWGEDPHELVKEVIDLGYKATLVSVSLEGGNPDWVGKVFTADLAKEIADFGADPCGERGEYHTFVWDGPLFSRPVDHVVGEHLTTRGHRFIDLRPGPWHAAWGQ